MEILASDSISGKSSNAITNIINVLNLPFLIERAKQLVECSSNSWKN